ncbi:hypothetical protein BH10ACT11_BH10ACT11_11410 [soil metagenome]
MIRLLGVCAVVSLLALSAGCGSSDRGGTATGGAALNTAKVESAIQESILKQRGVQAQVSCPADVEQKKGIVFSCDAVVDSDTTEFTVTQTDDDGNVHYEAL